MIGISAVSGLDLRRCATSKPLKSGIITSSSTKSGCSLSTCSKACRPLFAVAIANFSFVKSTFNNNTLDITSSTMRILYSEGFISMFIFVLYFFPLLVPYLFRNDTCRNIQSCGASLPPTLLQAASPVYVWPT